MNRVLGGGMIIKKERWLVNVCWRRDDMLPTVSIKKTA